MNRRSVLRTLGATPLVTLASSLPGCTRPPEPAASASNTGGARIEGAPSVARFTTSGDPVVSVEPLSTQWRTKDPFLFCAHHDDAYPIGNESMGPRESLAGRDIGQDFSRQNGWSMYHGSVVPGFPQHPHRGFETVTITRKGLVDHSDSLGATARYGDGDVQWLTAGAGIQHAEMFPLVSSEHDNPLELFQLWLNLPRADKFADPHFSMLWSDRIPRHTALDRDGRRTEVTVIAGALGSVRPLAPPPRSYAARARSEIAIWTLKMAPNARYTLPVASAELHRMLYFFRGAGLRINERALPSRHLAELRAERETTLVNGADEGELLLLQGRPIGEPVAQRGPFVMNSMEEIQQAYSDYQRTRFGGWPWRSFDPVHAKTRGRFAVHADGHRESA
ncbi:MAG: pirin family protein [Myxococcales bacterium]|nr:pirin family protein [Myxococcales bacterium]